MTLRIRQTTRTAVSFRPKALLSGCWNLPKAMVMWKMRIWCLSVWQLWKIPPDTCLIGSASLWPAVPLKIGGDRLWLRIPTPCSRACVIKLSPRATAYCTIPLRFLEFTNTDESSNIVHSHGGKLRGTGQDCSAALQRHATTGAPKSFGKI